MRTVALVLLALGACSAPGPEPLTVFCGAASRPALDRAAAEFEEATGVPVELVYGGSGTVLSQMRLAERGDVYLPSSPDFMERAVATGQVLPETRATLAWLVPGLVVPEGNPAGVRSLADLGRPGLRVGIGNPETVVLGQYTVELLAHNGLLDATMPNVVGFGASCSSVTDMAAMGSVDAVISWRVVERWNQARLDLVELEPGQVPRVSWIPVAVSSHSARPELAQRFVDWLRSPAGQQAYAEAGYATSVEQALQWAPGAVVGGDVVSPEGWLEAMQGRGARP